jgi:hypothetical protein
MGTLAFLTLREAIAFSGLSARTFFGYEGYWNADTFSLVVQRFVKREWRRGHRRSPSTWTSDNSQIGYPVYPPTYPLPT